MKIENISLKTISAIRFKNEINVENNEKTKIFSDLSLISPCDAKYLINKKKINFKGNHLTKLPSDTLENLKDSVESRVRNLGISNYKIDRKFENNYATQAIDKLLEHKIMKYDEELVYEINNITTKLTTNFNEKDNSEALLDFADFIVSDSVNKIVDNSSIKKSLGKILCSVNPYNIDAKKNFINLLLYNPEILTKNTELGVLITHVNDSTYKGIVDGLGNSIKIVKNTKNLIKDSETKGFAQIGGQTNAIKAIQNGFIFPKEYPELHPGIKPEKGAILFGPPGTGKSLLAKALSEESNNYFVSISATEPESKYVGGTEENWRNLFEDLKSHQPAILFIDEADALCRKRGSVDIHGDKQLNQFLKLMSDLNFDNTDVFVLMATNNLGAFDDAVLRDGRFGLHIEMLPPQNEKEVEEIFNIHSKDLKLDKDVSENRVKIFKKMLELKLTGSGIEGVLKNSHSEALNRLGLYEKMRNKTVTREDIDNFTIKYEDILVSLNKRKENQKRSIGFVK